MNVQVKRRCAVPYTIPVLHTYKGLLAVLVFVPLTVYYTQFSIWVLKDTAHTQCGRSQINLHDYSPFTTVMFRVRSECIEAEWVQMIHLERMKGRGCERSSGENRE